MRLVNMKFGFTVLVAGEGRALRSGLCLLIDFARQGQIAGCQLEDMGNTQQRAVNTGVDA